MRSIWVDNQRYDWRAGQSHVIIRKDGEKFAAPSFAEVLGLSYSDVDRAQWKGYCHVKPADVAGYIIQEASRRKGNIT